MVTAVAFFIIMINIFSSFCLSGSLRTADAFPVVASLPPKNSVCEPEQQNDFRDVKPFVLMLAYQIKGWSYSSSESSRPGALECLGFRRVSKYALEREFHDHNKVSCDVDC